MSDEPPNAEQLKQDKMLELAPHVARFWWIGVLRGAIALALGSSALMASATPERLATYLALYWLAGGVVTLRFAWAIRPSVGFRLASGSRVPTRIGAGVVAITAALLVVLREFLSGVVSPSKMINVLGFTAAAMGTLRLVGAAWPGETSWYHPDGS